MARYYFVLESPHAKFTKTFPQLARCLVVLPKQQQIWPLLLLGQTYQVKGEYDKAKKVYQKIEGIEPDFPFTQVGIGETLAASGQHQQAIAMYQSVIDKSQYYTAYPVARSIAYSRWAESLIAMGDLDQAEKILREGISSFALSNKTSEADAITHNALGRFFMKHRQDYGQAEYHLRQAFYMDDKPEYYADLQAAVAKQIPGFDTLLTESSPQDHAKTQSVEAEKQETLSAGSQGLFVVPVVTQ